MSSNSIPVPAAWLAIYLPVSKTCIPVKYFAVTWVLFMHKKLQEGIHCLVYLDECLSLKEYVAIVGSRSMGEVSDQHTWKQDRQFPLGLVYLVPTPTDLSI